MLNNANLKSVKLFVKVTLMLLLSVTLCMTGIFFDAFRSYAVQIPETTVINIDGTNYEVHVLNHDYDNNMYLSLKDMSVALGNTDKAFVLERSQTEDGESRINLTPCAKGTVTEPEEDEDSDKSEDDIDMDTDDNGRVNFTRKRQLLNINGTDCYFYVIPVNGKDDFDCYVNCGEFALSMNLDMTMKDNAVYINTKGEFDFSKYDLKNSGLQYMTDSCMVGDATTGDIYLEENSDQVVTIASTSKLMTYLIIREAIENGELSYNDTVRFSAKAAELSRTSDGVVRVEEGQTATLSDVMKAMLICSSNECALALAEHYSGSEEAFVELMNRKTVALGMSGSAYFFNPHGLPIYQNDVLTVKKQNHMTAADMFILTSHILNKYPDVTEITSIKKTKLESLNNFVAKNTNVLLYNVPGTVGLKTGTTDKAQSCLVSAYETVDSRNDTHYIVTIVYGTENVQCQSYTSMVLMRYGIQHFNATMLGILPEGDRKEKTPETLEEMVEAVMAEARR
ncbi:MAG: serine hydrolase [Lachnospiraceae bacterium]|nr:serine hydrolase [Lachnospiraceae bacterium]